MGVAPPARHAATLISPSPDPRSAIFWPERASFAEVIRRDPASRLHFLPVGRDGELDLHEFANVLDALAGIYDFVLIIAPPLDQNETAKTLAAKTRFAVLAIPAGACGSAVFEAERQLIESGACEVLLIGLPTNAAQGLGRNAA